LLAGSAINGFTGESGGTDPVGGAEAMRQALAAYVDPGFDNSPADHVPRLRDYAGTHGYRELTRALSLRYGHND